MEKSKAKNGKGESTPVSFSSFSFHLCENDFFFTILALKKRNSEKTYLRSIQIFEIIEKESFA